MSRTVKNRTQIADLHEVRPLSTMELQQIGGGASWEATLLYAMGWKVVQQTYMDTNGMTYTKSFWVPPPK